MDTFITKLQEQNRIAVPLAYVETLRLRKGDKVRVSIERVR